MGDAVAVLGFALDAGGVGGLVMLGDEFAAAEVTADAEGDHPKV